MQAAQHTRHLYAAQPRDERREFGDERVLRQVADLLLAGALASAEQIGHGHLQRARQARRVPSVGVSFSVSIFEMWVQLLPLSLPLPQLERLQRELTSDPPRGARFRRNARAVFVYRHFFKL
jgi:hypothetical protein